MSVENQQNTRFTSHEEVTINMPIFQGNLHNSNIIQQSYSSLPPEDLQHSARICSMAQAKAFAVVALCWAVAIASLVHADTIFDVVNQCTQDITACSTDQSGVTNCNVLTASTGTETINVGTVWEGGAIWAFPAKEGTDVPTGVLAKPQADLAEFTINDLNSGQDSYDISVVNAYNLGMAITLTSIAGGVTPGGTTCEPITCSIGDLTAFCQPPNKLTGPPGDGCYNVDGPGTVSTVGTQQFAAACPNAISYSTDTTGKVYGCPTTSNYKVTFCP